MMAPSPLTTPVEGGGSGLLMDGGRGGTLATTGQGGNNQMGTISLGTLIQYINQRTYSDLLNLAEILPRKSDMEKKIDIVQFAQRTRQLYVRLLALVKWAASASKVDKCCHIMNFLEKQNSLLTDTADKLFHMTRDNLVLARLPHFHIPAAVQTLTTGTYDRLPLSIRQRIIPPDVMTAAEKRSTLTRLEQIIRHRLMEAALPHQMRTTKVESGRVVLTVEQEFEVHLTVGSDAPTEAWRLLAVHILVEDRETGRGKELVHPMQVWYLQQVVQSRLVDHPNPLQELYTVLHAFCLSLQLEVLYAQTLKLLEERLDYHIRIEEYVQGSSLSLTYWRELSNTTATASSTSVVIHGHGGIGSSSGLSSKASLGYRLTVQIDPNDPGRPLHLLHTPAMPQKECEVATRAIRSEQLSMERLLVHTIHLRTRARLAHLKQALDDRLGLAAGEKCVVGGSPAVLQVPLLQPCLRSEQLLITVDTQTGILTPHTPQYPRCPLMPDLHTALNAAAAAAATSGGGGGGGSSATAGSGKLTDLISELRYWLLCRRTEKSLQHLAASVHDRLPLMYDASHPLHALAKHKVFVTLHRHPNYVLIVEVKERPPPSTPSPSSTTTTSTTTTTTTTSTTTTTPATQCLGNGVEQRLYLLLVREASIEDDPNDPSVQTSLPRSYMRAYRLMPLDSFLCAHGPNTKIDVCEPSSTPASVGSNKRRMQQQQQQQPLQQLQRDGGSSSGGGEPTSKRIKVPAYFMPDVAQCVALCDQLCPLAHINSQLLKAGVRTGGVQVEDGGVGLVVRVVGLPPSTDPITTTTTTATTSTAAPTTTTAAALTAAPTEAAAASHAALASSLLCMAIRVQVPQFRGVKSVVVEYIFTDVPFTTTKEANSPNRRCVVSVHEMSSNGVYASNCVEAIVAEWRSIARLYHLVHHFAVRYHAKPPLNESSHDSLMTPPLSEIVRIRSYNYKMISLSYGPNFCAYCNVRYSTEEKAFALDFGCEGGSGSVWATNPHSLLKVQLTEEVAAAGDDGLLQLATLLHQTYQPCLALAKLQPTLHPGVLEKRHQTYPVEVFSVVGHSGTSVRVVYRNLYCLAVQALPGGLVAVRDGAFSAFDNSRIIDEFLPIQGLKAFLNKYVDESALSRRRSQSEDDNPPTPVPLEDSPWPAPPKPSSPARHGPITPPVSSNPHTPASPHPVSGGFSASPAGGGGFALASPPSLPGMNPSPAGGHMSHPSPGAFPAASPSGSFQQQQGSGHGVASPSFLTVPSPAAAYAAGGLLGSMHSPAATFLQGGGGMQVSRVLPNKTYAAAIPTLLPHHAFHTLCSPPPPPTHQGGGTDGDGGAACVLEQFLGCTYLRRILNQASKNSNETPSSDGGSVQFKTESLVVCASLVSSPSNCLVLKLQPVPDYADRWTPEEMQVLEKFFSLKVACAPYKPNAMTAFHQILRFPHKILKDCVRIMQLEVGGQGQVGAKWLVQWCLTVPPIGPQLVPPGAVGVIISRNKILFFLQLTRASTSTENDSTGGGVIVPVVHDINTNKTQMAKRSEQQQAVSTATDPSIRLSHAINELMARPVVPSHESSVFPCVRELLMHLNVGPDGMPYPPTSQTPTQPPTLPSSTSSSTSQVGSPHMASPHSITSPHPQPNVSSSTTPTPISHYPPVSSGHMQASPMGQPVLSQSSAMVQSNTMGQPNTMGQQGAMAQQAAMGQPNSMGHPNNMAQVNTMGQTGTMGQPGTMGQSNLMSQANTMGQPTSMGQSPSMGQPGLPGSGMGMQGSRVMQGMAGLSQGMQPNMPANQGMQGTYGSNMYR